MKYPIVHIKWIDASGGCSWMPLGDMEHAANIIEIDTIGFLVGDFDDRLVVSASISDNEQCDGYIAIPREWVKEYWEITI